MSQLGRRIFRFATYIAMFILGFLVWMLAYVMNFPALSSFMFLVPILFVVGAYLAFRHIDAKKAEKEWEMGKQARMDADFSARRSRNEDDVRVR